MSENHPRLSNAARHKYNAYIYDIRADNTAIV